MLPPNGVFFTDDTEYVYHIYTYIHAYTYMDTNIHTERTKGGDSGSYESMDIISVDTYSIGQSWLDYAE